MNEILTCLLGACPHSPYGREVQTASVDIAQRTIEPHLWLPVLK